MRSPRKEFHLLPSHRERRPAIESESLENTSLPPPGASKLALHLATWSTGPRLEAKMLGVSQHPITVLAVLVAKPQMLSTRLTVALTLISIVAIFLAWRGERRRE